MTEPELDIEKIALDLLKVLTTSADRAKWQAEGVRLLYEQIVRAASGRQQKEQSDVPRGETETKPETQP